MICYVLFNNHEYQNLYYSHIEPKDIRNVSKHQIRTKFCDSGQLAAVIYK